MRKYLRRDVLKLSALKSGGLRPVDDKRASFATPHFADQRPVPARVALTYISQSSRVMPFKSYTTRPLRLVSSHSSFREPRMRAP
jgi:hypothetical protein